MRQPDEDSDYLTEWRDQALRNLNENSDYLYITHIIPLLCTMSSFEESNRWKGLLLDAHRRKRLPSKPVKTVVFAPFNERRNKNLMSRFKTDEQYQQNSFWEYFSQDHDNLYHNDEFSWQLLQFHRDDIKSFIQSCYQWPLPENIPLREWFKDPEADIKETRFIKPDKKATPLLIERIKPLIQFLNEKGIPEEEWKCLPATLTRHEIYEELKTHTAFQAQDTRAGKTPEINFDTFIKDFWKNITINFRRKNQK